MAPSKVDVTLDFCADGDCILFRLKTDKAEDWIESHFGHMGHFSYTAAGKSVHVGSKYVEPVMKAMHEDGITFEKEGC